MKGTNKYISLLVLLLSLAMIFCLAACKEDAGESETDPAEQIYTLTLDKKVVMLNINESDKVTASLYLNGQYCSETVTLASSDTSVVKITQKGEITALKEGEATVIASYNGLTCECQVIVTDSGAGAYLTFPESALTVKENEIIYANPQVRYNGRTYSNVNCSYEIVEGDGEAAIDSAGAIQGVKVGGIRVKATGKWGDFDGADDERMVAYIDVAVIYDINLALDEFSSSVYKAETVIGGVAYSNKTNVGYSIMHGSLDVKGNADYPIEWHYDDEDIAEVRDGVLHGKNAGEVELYFTCTYGGYTYESNKVKAYVELPVVDMTSNAAIGELVAQEGVSLDAVAIFGREMPITLIEASGIIVSDEEEPSKLDYTKAAMGQQVLTVYNDEFAYKVSILVCTKLIVTYEDLLSLRYNERNTPSIGVGGYYLLANDIDCGGAVINGGSGWMSNGDGFRGELDGNGHTVKNLTVGSHGIFGTLGKNAYIHDIIFEDITQLGVYRSAILAAGAYGATVENVKITGLTVEMPDMNGDTERYTETGLLIARQTNSSATFKNIEIHAEGQVIACLLGYEISDPMPDYADITVYAKDIVSYGSHDQCIKGATDISELPAGVTVIKDK